MIVDNVFIENAGLFRGNGDFGLGGSRSRFGSARLSDTNLLLIANTLDMDGVGILIDFAADLSRCSDAVRFDLKWDETLDEEEDFRV